MESKDETSNAGEVPKPQAHTSPPRLNMSMTRLPNGTFQTATASAAVEGDNWNPLVTKKRGRPRKYRLFNPDAMSASQILLSPDVETPMMEVGSGDDGFWTALSGINAAEPSFETCNTSEVSNPRAYTPPPRLEMSMIRLPDGTCHYQRVVPATTNAGDQDGVQLVKVPCMKKEGNLRKGRQFMTSSTAENPVVPSLEVVSLVSDIECRDDGSVGSANLVGITALGSVRNNITPYVIDIKAGQDILSIISPFCQKGCVSVLSASGAVSQVALYQAASSGGVTAYEGRFEILLLSGLLSETGGLRVLLAGSNCQVFGGHLASILIAASAVEVILASFTVDN